MLIAARNKFVGDVVVAERLEEDDRKEETRARTAAFQGKSL